MAMTKHGRSHARPPIALIVTPQEWLRLAVESIFAPRGYAAVRGGGPAQAIQRVRDTPIDLLIIDADLRDVPGAALCAHLREERLVSVSTPVLLVAPHAWNREDRIAALRAGAWDACSLPLDAEELFLRVDAWVRSKLATDAIREQGLLDSTTGLYNAQGLLRRLAEVAAGATRYGRPFACLLVAPAGPGDHPASPAAAARLAAALRDCGRAADAVGMLNASEFVIVAPETDAEGARGLAHRLSAAFSANGETRLHIGCCASSGRQTEPVASSEMLVRAAQALRRAESHGQEIGFFATELC
jgi:PleD family two-component response regulator